MTNLPLVQRLTHAANLLRRLGYKDLEATVIEAKQALEPAAGVGGAAGGINSDTLTDRLARRAAHAEQLGFRGAARDILEAIEERRKFATRNILETDVRISELLRANEAEVTRRRAAEANDLVRADGHFVGLDRTDPPGLAADNRRHPPTTRPASQR